MIATVLEKILSVIIEDGSALLGLKPRKDREGYICLRHPPSYYLIVVLLGGITLVFIYLMLISPAEDLPLALTVNTLFAIGTVLFFFELRYAQYRFNDREIIYRNLFKRERTIFWNDCSVKSMGRLSHQIVVYNHEFKFRINQKMIGFNHLLEMLGRKLNKTRAELL